MLIPSPPLPNKGKESTGSVVSVTCYPASPKYLKRLAPVKPVGGESAPIECEHAVASKLLAERNQGGIGGNKLRLVAAIHFNAGRVFVRAVLTHREYGKGGWK